jgi:hypothetical protein
MEKIIAISRLETDFTRRLEEVRESILRLQSPQTRKFSRSSGERGFDRDLWGRTAEALEHGDMLEAYRSFCEKVDADIAEYADKSALSHKADRLFVDSVLRNSENYVRDDFRDIVKDEFSDVQAEINQIRDMISTVRDQAAEQVALLRRELGRIKNGVPETTAIDIVDPEMTNPDKTKSSLRLSKTAEFHLKRTPVRPVRSGYKKRTVPYSPLPLEVVNGSLIQDLERRSSFDQRRRRLSGVSCNSRYCLPL